MITTYPALQNKIHNCIILLKLVYYHIWSAITTHQHIIITMCGGNFVDWHFTPSQLIIFYLIVAYLIILTTQLPVLF